MTRKNSYLLRIAINNYRHKVQLLASANYPLEGMSTDRIKCFAHDMIEANKTLVLELEELEYKQESVK